MPKVVLVLDDVAINRVRYSWDGMIGRDLNRRLRTLEYRARASAGVKTGNLRSRMETQRSVSKSGLEGRVGTPVKYAKYHHEGTRPHVIVPKKVGGSLKFMIGGRVVFASRVKHPGTRPNPFLARWLREAVR